LNIQTENENHKSNSRPAPRSLWITLEAPEVIELKRISMDRDENGAVTFFQVVLVPRLRVAAQQRGIDLDKLLEQSKDERIPG
jgi:hypothetical protein